MKKNLLVLIISSAFMMSTAQTIQNTTWACYNPSNVFFRYYSFSTDSVFFTITLPVFTPFATYSDSSQVITINDFSGTCPGMPGKYSYLIQNDTLRFTLISDLCTARANIFGSYYLVGITTGIHETNSLETATVFPNPSANGIFNLTLGNKLNESTTVEVRNSVGQLVFEEPISDLTDQHTVNLQNLPSGMYVMILQNKEKRRVFRIIK